MKKSLFGFSAKIAMAVLAVCSLVLTSCYEKPVPTPDEDPEYYVIGTVYDATTSAAINATVTVNGKAVTVTGGSFLQKLDAPGAVTVAAEADGYISVSRTVQVIEVKKNQVSVTSADIAMIPEGIVLPENSVVEGTMTVEELKSNFGFPANTEIDENGLIHVHEALALESHDGHSMAHTTMPYEVVASRLSGYIWDLENEDIWDFENEDVLVKDVMELVANTAMQTILVGGSYDDFKAEEVKEVVNENGEKCLLGVTVCHTFSQWTITYVFDGVVYSTNIVKACDTTIMPEFDEHDSHDNHDGHDNHGGSNAGGGAGDEE